MQFTGYLANTVDQLAGCKTPLCQDAEMILEMPTISRAKKKEEITHIAIYPGNSFNSRLCEFHLFERCNKFITNSIFCTETFKII